MCYVLEYLYSSTRSDQYTGVSFRNTAFLSSTIVESTWYYNTRSTTQWQISITSSNERWMILKQRFLRTLWMYINDPWKNGDGYLYPSLETCQSIKNYDIRGYVVVNDCSCQRCILNVMVGIIKHRVSPPAIAVNPFSIHSKRPWRIRDYLFYTLYDVPKWIPTDFYLAHLLEVGFRIST